MYTDIELQTLPGTAGEVTGSDVGDHPAERRQAPRGGAISLGFLVTSQAVFRLPVLRPGEGEPSRAANDRPPAGTPLILFQLLLTFCPFSSSFKKKCMKI